MKVLILSDYFSTWDVGGASRVLAEHVKGLSALGEGKIQVELVSGWNGRAGTESFSHPWRRARYKHPLYLPALAWKIRGALRDFRPDIVHIHQPLIGAVALGLLPAGLPAVYHFHSFWLDEKLSHAGESAVLRAWCGLKGRIEAYTLNRMRRVIVLSRYSKELLLSRFPGKAVTVIPGSVDTRLWPEVRKSGDGRPFSFLCLRRLDPRMGLDNLLAAFADFVRAEGRGCRLTIAGTGRCEAELRRQALDLGLTDCVSFEGRVPQDRLSALMAGHDCMVVPSRELEGFGMVVIEAFASGLPVLSTTVGGLSGFAGYEPVFHGLEDGSPASLLKGLIWARQNFCDPSLSARAREIAVRDFDTAAVGRRLYEYYREVLRDA